MKNKDKKSKCCNAKTEIHGDAEYLSFVCAKCGEECALLEQHRWVFEPQKTKK